MKIIKYGMPVKNHTWKGTCGVCGCVAEYDEEYDLKYHKPLMYQGKKCYVVHCSQCYTVRSMPLFEKK